jgi:hypothetical protein
MMFVHHRKHFYRLPRLVTGITLLFHMQMMFVPHRKQPYSPPQLVTGIDLLCTFIYIANGSIVTTPCEGHETIVKNYLKHGTITQSIHSVRYGRKLRHSANSWSDTQRSADSSITYLISCWLHINVNLPVTVNKLWGHSCCGWQGDPGEAASIPALRPGSSGTRNVSAYCGHRDTRRELPLSG